MQITQSIPQLLKRLWRHISIRRRGQFGLLLILMVLASFAEVLSIGAVLPFLGMLTAPERVFEHQLAQPFIQALELTAPEQLLLPLTIVFGVAVLFAGVMRILLHWAKIRLAFAVGADMSISIYYRTLYQPYAVHVARNSSEVIAGITSKTNAIIFSTIQPLLNIYTAGIMLTIVLVTLLSINAFVAIAAFSGFSLIYALIMRLSRKRLLVDSQRIARESVHVIKALQEGLGGIRDVLIDGTQKTYCNTYRNADIPLRRAQGNDEFIRESPRYGIEALGMLLIAILAYGLAQQPGGIATAIPILGALALGAQRMLPALQQAYAGWTSMRSGQASLHDALDLLDQPLPAYINQPVPAPLPFLRQIELKQLSFRYVADTPWILHDVNLIISRGSRVGFVGATGSGKSTLLDIVMGLLLPTQGTLEIDGQPITPQNYRAWQAHIAHVPQAIFLADSTIEENIAFGVPWEHIDHERVRHAARQAQIAETIESWPIQYRTMVGERGIRLSGGQRQRIGIARALYKQADVIIFDEATSALDNETELAVMQAIENLSENLTILMVAHRLTTLKSCTQIVELGDGKIRRIGSYQDIVADAV